MSRLPLEQMIASLRSPSASSSNEGTRGDVPVDVMSVSCGGSHATAGLREPGDVGHLLGRLLGEQDEQLLGGYPTHCRHAAQRGGLALLREVPAQELDRLPVVVTHLDADLVGKHLAQVLGPFVVLG